jgi:hypothetical protein
VVDEIQAAEPPPEEMKRSTRDPAALRRDLGTWLSGRLPDDAGLEISEVTSPSSTGMSSETLLFDAQWTEDGEGIQTTARSSPSTT